MSEQIIGMQQWFETPPGRYLLAWERAEFDRAVGDIFGYHALQLGLPELDALAANRMPHKWLALGAAHEKPGAVQPALLTDFAALPFEENSIDLVVLPHSLELNLDPHTTLREVERVLVPEGKVVVCCLNPASLWGLRQRRAHLYRRLGFGELFLPDAGEFIGYRRLRDWLRLLGFEVETSSFGCYRPALASDKWLERFDWMDCGRRALLADLRRRLFHRRGQARARRPADRRAWKTRKALASAPVPIANRSHRAANPEE
jgi:SAM-dependent methyltransferase